MQIIHLYHKSLQMKDIKLILQVIIATFNWKTEKKTN